MNDINIEEFYITSDLHLGHNLVSKNRGFNTPEEHDDVIIDNLLNIPRGSTLLCLGDISVRKDDYALTILDGIKKERDLTMVLAYGNHDNPHPMNGLKKQLEWCKAYSSVFDITGTSFQINHEGSILFTHYPAFREKYTNAKALRWMPSLRGWDCIVHGHTHSDILVKRKHVNVALEATNMKPLYSEELWEYVKKAKKM